MTERLDLQNMRVQNYFVRCTKGSIDIQFYRWMTSMKMLEFHLGVLPVALRSFSLNYLINTWYHCIRRHTLDVSFFDGKMTLLRERERSFLPGYYSATFEVLKLTIHIEDENFPQNPLGKCTSGKTGKLCRYGLELLWFIHTNVTPNCAMCK